MTQPLCAYRDENGDVCGKIEKDSRYRHAVLHGDATTMLNHEFQPQSTGESAPVNQHRPGCPRYSGVGECDCFDDIPASASPQGAGEQWKPDCDIEAMRNALSKLESQVCRNPDLPEAYKTILRDGFKAVGNIELRLKAGAQGAGEPAQTQKCPYGCTMAQYDIRCPKHRPPTPDDQLNTALIALLIHGPSEHKGAVPGPQLAGVLEAAAKDIVFQLGVMSSEQNVFNYKSVLSILRRHLATPEPHSPPATSGYVQKVRPDDAEGPSCHVCGALMVRQSREKVLELIESLAGFGTDSEEFMAQLQSIQKEYPGWDCKSCGATTGCTPMKEVSKGIFTSRFCNCPNQADEDGSRCPICGKEKGAGCAPAEGPRDEPCKISSDSKSDAILQSGTDERLAEIADRESKATPDWEQKGDTIIRKSDKHSNGIYVAAFGCGKTSWPQSVSDTQFAAHARADIPYLLRLVAELRQERDDFERRLSHSVVRAHDLDVKLAEQEKQWRSWGVVEVAVRNRQVADYCNHWEGRALKAEEELSHLQQTVAFQEKEYLAGHGGSWGKCKYQGQVESATARAEQAERERDEARQRIAVLEGGNAKT